MAQPRPSAPAAGHPVIELTPRQKLIVMLAVLLGLFLSALDQTIVGTAMPRIVSDLRGNDLYTWVVTAYLLTSTITVPIYAKLGDVFGRQRMMLIGILIFLAGSALSGLSQNMGQLITFRSLQGLGAGALFPISLAVIGDLFTPRERGRYQGLFGAVFGISFIVGPFLGGFLTDNISWHWVFYVNLPIGAVALFAIGSLLPNVRTTTARLRDLDYSGIAIFTAGVVPLLLGLTYKGLTDGSGQQYEWTDFRVGGLILIGLLILAGFLFNESVARQPIIPLDLFTNRTMAASNVAVFMVSCGMFAAVIFVPRFYQVVRGVSATGSGYSMWPLLIGLIGTSIGSGILVSRTGRYKLLLVVAMSSLVVGTFLMTHIQAGTSTPLIWLWLALVGLGIGPSLSVFTVVVQNAAPPERLGTATGTLTFLRQIGGSVGLAVAGTVFSQSFTSGLPGQLRQAGVPDQVATRLSSGSGFSQSDAQAVGDLGQTILAHAPAQARPALTPLIPNIVEGFHAAFGLAIGSVFWIAVIAAGLAFAATLAVQEIPLRGAAAPSLAGPPPGRVQARRDPDATGAVAAV